MDTTYNINKLVLNIRLQQTFVCENHLLGELLVERFVRAYDPTLT